MAITQNVAMRADKRRLIGKTPTKAIAGQRQELQKPTRPIRNGFTLNFRALDSSYLQFHSPDQQASTQATETIIAISANGMRSYQPRPSHVTVRSSLCVLIEWLVERSSFHHQASGRFN